MSAVTQGWRFGVGQTMEESLAEEVEAHRLGRHADYLAAYDAAHAGNRSSPRAFSTFSTYRSAASPTSAEPGPGPRPCPCDTGDGKSEMREQLAAHARGGMVPVTVTLSGLDGASLDARRLAADVALCVGLRLHDEDARPMPYSCRFAQERLGVNYKRASRILAGLVRRGTLTAEAPMPGTGTAVYGVPGYTETHSDGVPMAGGKPGPVAVEAQEVGGPGLAVEPRPEPVDEPGVGDAVGRAPAGSLGGTPAVVGSAESRLAIGHRPERYARPETDVLLARYVGRAEPGNRNRTGHDLAQQVWWSGHDEGEVLRTLLAFQEAVTGYGDHRYTVREARATARSVVRQERRGEVER